MSDSVGTAELVTPDLRSTTAETLICGFRRSSDLRNSLAEFGAHSTTGVDESEIRLKVEGSNEIRGLRLSGHDLMHAPVFFE
jgi:hypothetical protein